MKRSTSPKMKSRSTSPDIRRLKRKLNHSSLSTNKPVSTVSTIASDMKNHDVCDSCGGVGQFLCCDACPNAFHFSCVEPPMDSTDVAKLKEKWYCTECEVKQNKKNRNKSNPRGLFHKLIDDISTKNPKAFKLPNDIVNFFKGVSSDKLGRYIDTTQIKQVKYKNGEVEHPDYYQLKDKSGKYRICYYCRKSALKKPMIACDYCTLYWHLDCLTPPLASAPNPAKKWRCPNHIEHIIQPPREQRNSDKIAINNENKIPSSTYRHHIAHIIEKELDKVDSKKQVVVKTMKENIITSKHGVVYRIPVNPIKPDFASYVKKITKSRNNNNNNNNNNIIRRRSSIPSTTASSSSSSEVNTPPLFNNLLPISSQKSQPQEESSIDNNNEEVEAWLQSMAFFQAGGQPPINNNDSILTLIRAAKEPLRNNKRRFEDEAEEAEGSLKKRKMSSTAIEKYQKIETLLRQKSEQDLLKLLSNNKEEKNS